MADSTANTKISAAPDSAVSSAAATNAPNTQAPMASGSATPRLVVYRQAKYVGGPV